VFDLEPHGPDTYVGVGPQYPWGGLYGGQIVAQALRAAASTVDGDAAAHSLRAYFIRRGDAAQPIRYEVDRIRNGRSFSTRRVVARQAAGAILNLEASFQVPERSASVTAVEMPVVPPPEDLVDDSWSPTFDRRIVPADITGRGRAAAWFRVKASIDVDDTVVARLLHACWLAYVSDDMPTDAVITAHPVFADPVQRERAFSASLDHTIWFHQPAPADDWQLHDFRCQHFVDSRGLTIGHVFTVSGAHIATVAQEVLVRDPGDRH
jgi:acyl-CoA thioesterase-2